MKTTLTIIIISLITCNTMGQQYGWVDMSSHVPATSANANLTDVSVVGESVWISTSNHQGIYRSFDGGNTFTFDSLPIGVQGLYRFPDGQRGWGVGGAWGVYTTDGGNHWNNSFIGSTLLSVTFANDSVGYATGMDGHVYRTDNGGNTWTLQSEPGNINRDALDAAFPDSLNPLTGFVCIANEVSTVFSTSTGGSNWNVVTLPAMSQGVNDLEIINPSLGWGVGAGNFIFKYNNSVWTAEASPIWVNLMAATATNEGNDVWAVGNVSTTGIILHRDQSGNWVQEAVGIIPDILQGVDAVDEHTVYAVGCNKTFLKYMQISDQPENESTFSVKVSPNPATHTLNIECPQSQNLNVSLFNLIGEQVMQRNITGTKESVDISALPAGMYFARITMDKQMIVKKIIKQ
jgi:hypothetical protein